MQIAIKWLLSLILSFPLISYGQNAQFDPYRGGIGDGYSPSSFMPYEYTFINMYSPFAGAAQGDGYSSDSLFFFNPRGTALLNSPFLGTANGDGFSSDSLISFQQGFIAIFNPFAGGISDGYHEAVLCKFPNIEGDTTVFLLCSNDSVNLNDLVGNYNFAGRWNTMNPTSAGPGTYNLLINNAGKCLDTATVLVKLDVVVWTGTADDNWHNAANWQGGKIPTEVSHVIIPGNTPHGCVLKEADASILSLQAKSAGNIEILNERNLLIAGNCISLPQVP